MQSRHGFTIIELIIVITIMGILMTLSVVSMTKNEANARDTERNNDIANIARGLENRYNSGNSRVTAPSYVSPGSYPGVYEMQHILGGTDASFTPNQIAGGYTNDALPGTEVANFTPPDLGGADYNGFYLACTSSCTTADAATTSVSASLTIDSYYYLPIDANGNVCMQGSCVRFKLFWKTEVDGLPHVMESKHQ